MNRTIVIGDLHGCYREAVELLNKLAVQPSDRVIFVGDLVDRGPDSAACVDLAMKHECVLGNHEEKHLQQRRSKEEKLSPEHQRTRAALTDAHYAYLETLPLQIALPEFNAVVVHGGAYPGRTMIEQEPYHLLHIQCVKPPGRKSFWPSKAPADHLFWTRQWQGPERVIFGHSVLSKPLVLPHAVGIDTGAVFGGGLTAVVLPQWELVTVPTRNSNGGKSRVATFEIDDDVRVFS